MAKLRVDKIASVGASTETTGSVFFDSSNNNHLAIQDHPDLEIHTNCTFECFINFDSVPTSQTFFLGKTDSFWIAYDSTAVGGTADRFTFAIFNGSSWTGTTSSFGSAPTAGRWYHLAAVKEGTSMKLYVDGKLYGSNTFSGTPDDTTNNFNVLWGSNNTFDGYVSNVRFIKDRVFYTSDFAAPTRELEVVDGTVLLCCHDGENIFADKTGNHIIRAVGDRTSSPTPTATDSPIGITTNNPGLTRDVDNTFGPTFQGGVGYASQNWLTLPKGTTTERNQTGGRGLIGGGQTPSNTDTINYITISSMGNSIDFGNLTDARHSPGSCASDTRGLFAGGGPGVSNSDIIDFVTIATTGNAVDFGNLTDQRRGLAGCGNKTRGLFGGGLTPGVSDIIDFVTIATIGNATDFGNLTASGRAYPSAASSPTRGLFAGGYNPGVSDVIDYVTIASTGDATDFGNLTDAREALAGNSSNTRAIFGGGNDPSASNIIDFVTIATIGNATDFGDLTSTNRRLGSCSNSLRGLFVGGSSPTEVNRIDYVTITSTGNAQDFGDLIAATDFGPGGCSDSHGGLS